MNESRRRLIAWITRTCAGTLALALGLGIFALLYATKPQVDSADQDRLPPSQRQLVGDYFDLLSQ